MLAPLELAREWLNYARNDLRVAEHLTSMEPPPYETICFHCQQAAEKALKGFMVFNSQEPPRTHDLEPLRQICGALEPDFSAYEEPCKQLTAYAVVVRYPNELQVELEDAEMAIRNATSILTFVESVIK